MEIAQEEARLAGLDRKRDESYASLERLHRRLVAIQAEPVAAPRLPINESQPVPATPAEKVKLFRSLFRGREEVFPTRFVSRRTGRQGYAPACANKFVRGVCELPRIKCGECPSQAFLPVDDQAVLGHLRGRHVMGVYPLLENETCWFLEADFDKGSWPEDIAAFVEVCRSADVPVAVERSRSGQGAHAWIFFSTPVSASTARAMGCSLITEAMTHHHLLSMASYDRLFPNQDTMPQGGFGNLIALPLQHEARQQGNTVFLDEGAAPYPDQWLFLSSVTRIEAARVDAIARSRRSARPRHRCAGWGSSGRQTGGTSETPIFT